VRGARWAAGQVYGTIAGLFFIYWFQDEVRRAVP
jgi:hypothetical protein